jgi:hypothetical protein
LILTNADLRAQDSNLFKKQFLKALYEVATYVPVQTLSAAFQNRWFPLVGAKTPAYFSPRLGNTPQNRLAERLKNLAGVKCRDGGPFNEAIVSWLCFQKIFPNRSEDIG